MLAMESGTLARNLVTGYLQMHGKVALLTGSNSVLRDYLREINSKHTLLITDACFGGSIFKTRAAFMDATLAVNKLTNYQQKAMTSEL